MNSNTALAIVACAIAAAILGTCSQKTPQVACIEQRGNWVMISPPGIISAPLWRCDFGKTSP